MDDDTGPSDRSRILVTATILVACVALASWVDIVSAPAAGVVQAAAVGQPVMTPGSAWRHFFPLHVRIALVSLTALSAFFSSSEASLFSRHRSRFSVMDDDEDQTGRLIAYMRDHQTRLLSTILVGKVLVNVVIAVLLPLNLVRVFEYGYALPPAVAYPAAILLCALFLVLIADLTPRVLADAIGPSYARTAAPGLRLLDWVLRPITWSIFYFADFLFGLTRLGGVKAAPFISDAELKSAVSTSDARTFIEEEEGQMIQGILEFNDALLREILIPRPDIVALSETATVREALDVFRENEYSRMPVFHEDLDHITGILFAKDLLPCAIAGQWQRPVKELGRPPRYVPETMTAHAFVKDAQRLHLHMAIVVDEYGGTEGLVTLEDAIECVVGDIKDPSDEDEPPLFTQLEDGVYRVDGAMPLEEFAALTGIAIADEEHETIGGFIMDKTNKIPEPGDCSEHEGIAFTVENVDGKRVATLRVELPPAPVSEEPAE